MILAVVIAYLLVVILGLPVNLFYHVGFCVLIAAVMFVVVACAWPRYLDKK